MWSALDDEQLRGRIYMFPQQKIVRFYRLVARGTPDVFLNNLAFDKGMLHNAFIGIDDNTRMYSFILYSPSTYTHVLVALFNGNDSEISTTTTATEIDSEVDVVQGDEDVEMIDAPQGRNKRGNKKTRVKKVQPPQSPPRPASKRPAPTSPTSPQRAPHEGKKLRSHTQEPSAPGPSFSSLADPGPSAVNQPISSTTSGSPTPATAPMDTPDTSEPFNPDTDPILQAMQSDPTWQMDPDELDNIAALNLHDDNGIDPRLVMASAQHSSPLTNLSSLPSSPMAGVVSLPVVQPGLASRIPDVSSTPSNSSKSGSVSNVSSATHAGPSVAQTTNTDAIGGVPLIPSGHGRFKPEGRGRGKPRGRGTRGKGRA